MFILFSFVFSLKIKNEGSILTVESSAEFELVGPKKRGQYAFKNSEGKYLQVKKNGAGFGRTPTYFQPIEKNGKYQMKTGKNCWQRTISSIGLGICRPIESQFFVFEGDCALCVKGNDSSDKKKGSNGSDSETSSSSDKAEVVKTREPDPKENELRNLVRKALSPNRANQIGSDNMNNGISDNKMTGDANSRDLNNLHTKENFIRANILSNQLNIRLKPKNFNKNNKEYESSSTTESDIKMRNEYIKGLHKHTSLYKQIYSSPYYYSNGYSGYYFNNEYQERPEPETEKRCKKRVFTNEETIVSY